MQFFCSECGVQNLVHILYKNTGADPAFLKRGFKCRNGGFVCLILHTIS